MTSLENKQISLFPYPSVSSSLPPLFLPIILPLLPPSSSPNYSPLLLPIPSPSLGPATAPASRRTGPARPACPPERPRPLAWGEGEAAVPATGSPVEASFPPSRHHSFLRPRAFFVSPLAIRENMLIHFGNCRFSLVGVARRLRRARGAVPYVTRVTECLLLLACIHTCHICFSINLYH